METKKNIDWSELPSIAYARDKIRDWPYWQNCRLLTIFNPNWIQDLNGHGWPDLSPLDNTFRSQKSDTPGVSGIVPWGADVGTGTNARGILSNKPINATIDLQLTILSGFLRYDVSGGGTLLDTCYSRWDGFAIYASTQIQFEVARADDSNIDIVAADIPDPILYHTCCRGNGNILQIAINGIWQPATTVYHGVWQKSPLPNFQLFSSGSVGQYYLHGFYVSYIMIFDTSLPDDEVGRVSADPFYMIKRSRKQYFDFLVERDPDFTYENDFDSWTTITSISIDNNVEYQYGVSNGPEPELGGLLTASEFQTSVMSEVFKRIKIQMVSQVDPVPELNITFAPLYESIVDDWPAGSSIKVDIKSNIPDPPDEEFLRQDDTNSLRLIIITTVDNHPFPAFIFKQDGDDHYFDRVASLYELDSIGTDNTNNEYRYPMVDLLFDNYSDYSTVKSAILTAISDLAEDHKWMVSFPETTTLEYD